MTMLTAILMHLSAEDVDERVRVLRTFAPDAQFAVCYGGPASEFERIEYPEKLFIDDATLRGPVQHLQSLTTVFRSVRDTYFASDASLDSLYVIEYDHLVLDRSFETRLRELADQTGADVLGKNCVVRNATNDEHYVRFRTDRRLLAHLGRLSVRDDHTRIFGTLGDGIWISRRGLEAYTGLREHPPCYCETYVPTLLHHLGLNVVDIDSHSDLYRYVRWRPEFHSGQAIAALREGAVFMHPVKDLLSVRAVREAALQPQTAGIPVNLASSAERGN